MLLERGVVERIILSRPAVEAGERLGFLPGDMKEKVDPYLRPLYDALYDMMPADKVERAIAAEVIEIAPLAFMRGRTLAHAAVILDEAQNTTPMQMKMFLTRLGENARMIVTGDPSQIDLPPNAKSGLVEALRILDGVPGIVTVSFNDTDVVRHPLVAEIVRAYDGDAREHRLGGASASVDDLEAKAGRASAPPGRRRIAIEIIVEAGDWPTKPSCRGWPSAPSTRISAEIGASRRQRASSAWSSPTMPISARSTPAGAARTSRPTCCPSRPFRRAAATPCRRCSATSCWPPKRSPPRPPARASRSTDHITHLIVHGVLHLIGYDHETDAEAEDMEQAERRILAGLAIPDPYAITSSGKHQDGDEREHTDCSRPREPAAIPKASSQSSDGPSTRPSTHPNAAQPAAPDRPSLFERLTSFFRQRNGSSLREDIADALAESASDEAAFSPAERAMLNNILRFREVRVEDVMVPRADIEAVEINTTLGELMNLFEQSGHSRMPVYAETLDDPRGMVHIRDMVAHITRARPRQEGDGTTQEGAGHRRDAQPRPMSTSPRRSASSALIRDRAVRAALDARLRPDGAHAGDAHADGAGHRRIWRHRRAGLARRHRRDGRRRHRGRA